MLEKTVVFVSKRSQRWAAAFLALVLAHMLAAGCTPEPVAPLAVRIQVNR